MIEHPNMANSIFFRSSPLHPKNIQSQSGRYPYKYKKNYRFLQLYQELESVFEYVLFGSPYHSAPELMTSSEGFP